MSDAQRNPASGGGGNPEPVERLIEEFTKLPGIGRRSAERMAFHLLKTEPQDAMRLSQAVADVKEKVRQCAVCLNLTDRDVCQVCEDPSRDASTVLVVEQPKDLIGLEQARTYRGVYHVLMGRLDPLGGVRPEDLAVDQLVQRVADPKRNCREVPVKEVILGFNPNFEGDTTGLYVAEELAAHDVKVTRLARGLPVGSQLEFASTAVLSDAIQGRQEMGKKDDPAG